MEIVNWYIRESEKKLYGDLTSGGIHTFVQLPILKYKDRKVLVPFSSGKQTVILKNIDRYFSNREKNFIEFLEKNYGQGDEKKKVL